jgi:hypothetical protein
VLIIAIAVRASAGRDSHRHHANNRKKMITAVTEFSVAAHADPTHSLADDNRVTVFDAVTQV